MTLPTDLLDALITFNNSLFDSLRTLPKLSSQSMNNHCKISCKVTGVTYFWQSAEPVTLSGKLRAHNDGWQAGKCSNIPKNVWILTCVMATFFPG